MPSIPTLLEPNSNSTPTTPIPSPIQSTTNTPNTNNSTPPRSPSPQSPQNRTPHNSPSPSQTPIPSRLPSPQLPPNHTPPNSPSPLQSPIPSRSPSPQPSSPDISSDESDDDYGIPLERPPLRPMVNYAGDTEIKEDYEIGWEWLEHDTGPHIAPYTGFRQCLLDLTKNNPEDFFEALFSSHMYTIMAEETNKYMNRKLQRGKFFYIIFIYTKNVFFQP